MSSKKELVAASLRASDNRSAGCLFFNNSLKILEANMDSVVMEEIQVQVIDLMENNLSGQDGNKFYHLPIGLVGTLMAYFSHIDTVDPSQAKCFLSSLSGRVRDDALQAIFALWGPDSPPTRIAFPEVLRKEINVIALSGDEREKYIANIILKNISIIGYAKKS